MPINEVRGPLGSAAVAPVAPTTETPPTPEVKPADVPLGPRTSPLPSSVEPPLGRGPASSTPQVFGTKAFQGSATLAAIAAGAAPALKKGAPKNEAVGVAQTLLYRLGLLPTTKDVDNAFGPKTETAIRSFQKTRPGLELTGQLDAPTLAEMDSAAAELIQASKAASVPAGSKRAQFDVVVDMANSSKTRIYVLDKEGEPVARYLTSPGTSQFPTQGNSFRIAEVFPRRAWIPPASAWAANAKPVPPGIHNPMGILKLSFGMYAEYFHGIPQHEESDLGKAASHGCCRMSGANILEFHEKYCEAGSFVKINRDLGRTAELEAKFQEKALGDRPIDAGREHMFGYVSGELGKYQKKP